MKSKKNLFISSLIILVILFLLSLIFLLSKNEVAEEPFTKTIIPTPTIFTKPARDNAFLDIANIPTLPPGGVNINSQIVKDSENEIKKIYPLLPYKTTFNSSAGITLSIIIPPQNLQDNPWSLTIYIFGIDYQVPQESMDYPNTKISFKESGNYVLDWLKKNGVDINKIFIVWGDKFFIQERSMQWLKEN